MRSSKLGLIILFSLSVAFSVFFAACEFAPPEAVVKPAGAGTQVRALPELDRREQLALMFSQESFNYETPQEELVDIVQTMLQHNAEAQMRSAGSIVGSRPFVIGVEEGFASVPVNRRPETEEKKSAEINFYVFTIQSADPGADSSFALCCTDKRIGDLIVLTESGSFDDDENPFWEFFSFFA